MLILDPWYGTTLVHIPHTGQGSISDIYKRDSMSNSFIINGAIEQAVAFCMWAAMLSGPLALVISGELKSSTDSSLSHKGRQGTDWDPQGTCEGPVCLMVDVLGGEVVFKQIIFIYN